MKRIFAFLLMMGILLSIAPTFAQSGTGTPLLVSTYGKIYKLVGDELVKLVTGEGYSYSPDYSPEGTQFVYRTWSQITLDFAKAQETENGEFFWEGELPTDIAIYDLATDAYTIVSSQPNNADPETLLRAVRRSAPKWSPDGTKLAWSEVFPVLDEDGNFAEIYSLVVYDITTATTQVIAEGLPPAMIYSIPHDIQWGKEGLYLQIFNYIEDRAGEQFIYYPLVAGNGGYNVFFDADEANPTSISTFVTTYNDKEVFAVSYPNGTLRLISDEGQYEDLLGAAPMKYNSLTADGLANSMVVVNGNNSLSYTVTNPETQFQEILIDNAYSFEGIQISPDGASVAYIDWNTGAVNIWKNMEIITISAPLDEFGNPSYINDITWGNQAYRIIQS